MVHRTLNKRGRNLRKNNGLKLSEQKREMVKKFIRKTYFKILMALVLTAVTTFIFPIESLYIRLEAPKIGEIATEDIVAPFDFYILKTKDELEAEKSRVLNSLTAYLVYDKETTRQVRESVRRFFADLDRMKKDGNRSERIQELTALYPGLTNRQAELLIESNSINEIKPAVTRLIDSLLTVGVVDDIKNVPLSRNRLITLVRGEGNVTIPRRQVPDIPSLLSSIEGTILGKVHDPGLADAVVSGMNSLLRPNLSFSLTMTEEAKEKALAEVSPYKGVVFKDERIIRKHERVTQAHIEKLNSLAANEGIHLGEEVVNVQWLPLLARFAFVGFLFAFAGAFIRYFRKDIFLSNRKLLLIAVIFIGEVLATYLIDVQWQQSPYLIPIALASMLLTILFDVEVGLLMTVVISILIGVLRNFDFSTMFVAIIVGTVAAYSVRKVRHRHNFFRPSLYLVATYIFSVYVVESLKLQPAGEIIKSCAYGAINGALAPMLTIAMLPIFEYLFRITTDITLLELSDLNRPLLKRLSLEAPGTYHHSIIMGTLAEEAAKNIDANSLLARVGAYYHDIGKSLKAEYFVENQMGAKNKHEKLSPSMSALILESHVKEGREMAKAAGLPQVIIDFIEQHHGNSKMSYFYQKALDMGASEEEAASFHYPGPKPQFKEAAIVMLADSVEAASRTLEDPKPARIRSLVRNILHDKIQNGQLNDSNLTLRDIYRIEDSFVYIISAIFHRRIEYPEREDIAV